MCDPSPGPCCLGEGLHRSPHAEGYPPSDGDGEKEHRNNDACSRKPDGERTGHSSDST